MIILKVGGGKKINWDYIAQDLKKIREEFVIVHGANAWMKEISERLGESEKMIISPSGQISRYTNEKTMDILTMVYSGLVNKKIVVSLQKYGINAIGLSGADGRVWLAKRKDAILSFQNGKTKIIRDSLTGKVVSINTQLILQLVENGYVPVITIPAITPDGELINVDNDRAIAVMAKDLKIDEIIMLFEAPGLLTDPNDEDTLIKEVKRSELEDYFKKTEKRMRKKILGVKEAFDNGVKKIYFGDGRIPFPVSSALNGNGTIFS